MVRSSDNGESESICSGTDEYYVDCLFFAVESHNVAAVKTFTNEHLRHLCRIRRLFDSEWSAPEKEKQTAYQRACFLGYTDIVQCMLAAGVKTDQRFCCENIGDNQRSAFMFACHSGSMATIRALLQAVSSDYAKHFECRNRMAICSSSFAKQYLIPQESWVEESSSTTNDLELVFPIHFAIAQNNLEMARQIVTSTNNEVDRQNYWVSFRHEGFSPLHIACLFNRSIAMIELLLSDSSGGLNPLIQTSRRGMFADQMATDGTLIEYLRPKRLCIIAALAQERLKDFEGMQPEEPYQIFIRPLSGQTLTFTVTAHTTNHQLGAYFENECGVPPMHQKILFKGRTIPTVFYSEIQPLINYGITRDSILHIIWSNPK